MKNRLFFPSLPFLIFTFCFAFLSCNNPTGSNVTHTVRYVITGPQTIADLVLYTNDTGNFDQITNVQIPWEKTITVQGRKSVSCSALFGYGHNQTYNAKIFVDGKEIVTSSSSSIEVSVRGSTR